MATDPVIQAKADDIRMKVYGEQVRESLASGLEAMSEVVVDNTNRQDTVETQFQQVIENTTGKDVISAPEIIAARNNEANLKARLDKEHQQVTAQLAQKAVHVFPSMTTTQIQNVLDNHREILFTNGVFNTQPLFVKSNTVIYLSPNTIIQASVGFTSNQSLLEIYYVENVTIYGNNAQIKMLKSEYTTGEWRHGVNIFSSENVHIYNLISKDSGGDGFYVGGDINFPSKNVNLINCVGDNNRRQGLSIVNAITCNVCGGEFKNTIGTAPECGIDVESNPLDGYFLQNVNIENVRTSGNNGGGILISPLSASNPVSINVSNCTSENDGIRGGIATSGVTATTKIGGVVNISDCAILKPQGRGVGVVRWTENAPLTKYKNIYILNPASNQTLSGTIQQNQCGVLIRSDAEDMHGTSYGHVELENITVIDDRNTPLTSIPIFINNGETSKPMKDIRIKNIKGNAWANGSLTPIHLSTTPLENIRISYDNGYDVNNAPSQTLGIGFCGATISPATSSIYTLPLASSVLGATFTIELKVASVAQLIPNASDVIGNYSTSAGVGIISRQKGARITVKAVANNMWQVIDVSGGWGVSNYFGIRYPITYNSAVPTSGTWVQGDIIYNTTPVAGGKLGWVCTSGGNPGTWKAFGAIDA